MTNADKIRSMSDDQLAKFCTRIGRGCQYCPAVFVCIEGKELTCSEAFAAWLKEKIVK